MLHAALVLLLAPPAPAGSALPALRELSRRVEEGGVPPSLPEGLLKKGWQKGPRHFRYAPAVLAIAGLSPEGRQRSLALAWLGKYRCENLLACRTMHSLAERMGAALPAGLRNLFSKRKQLFSGQLPPRTGVCPPKAARAAWLSLEYQLLCPEPGFPEAADGCALFSGKPCSEEAPLKRRLGRDSMQDVMSSSFLSGLRHLGAGDCSRPWVVELACGGAVELSYRLSCRRSGSGKAAKVRCRELPQK